MSSIIEKNTAEKTFVYPHEFSIRRTNLSRLYILSITLIAMISAAAPAAQAQRASVVRVETVTLKPVTQTVPLIGRLVATRSGNIAAQIGGTVDEILFKIGDKVKSGQIIARLNSDSAKAEYALAAGELEEARADLLTYNAERELFQTELARQKALNKSSAFSQAKFDDAEQKVLIARAKERSAEAKIKVKLAGLERKKVDLEDVLIRSPYDGVVVRKFTEIGSYVKIGDPIVKLVGQKSIEIEAEIPSSRIHGSTIGKEIPFTLDDGSTHHAIVRSVLPSENPSTRTRTIRLVPQFSAKIDFLAEGQSVTLAIPIGPPREVIVAHKDAILNRAGQNIVFVVENDIAKPRAIIMGEAVGSEVEILNGLQPGEKIVVRGNERLRAGAKVRIERSSS